MISIARIANFGAFWDVKMTLLIGLDRVLIKWKNYVFNWLFFTLQRKKIAIFLVNSMHSTSTQSLRELNIYVCWKKKTLRRQH